MRDSLEQRYKLMCEDTQLVKTFLVIFIETQEAQMVKAHDEVMAYLALYGDTFEDAKQGYVSESGNELTYDNIRESYYEDRMHRRVLVFPYQKDVAKTTSMIPTGNSGLFYDATSQTF